MSAHTDRLYNLVPIAYRMRDAQQGYPLQMLLRVIEEQVDVVEDNITQLYENWFIETCEDWVVPYIADLIGYRTLDNQETQDSTVSALEKVLVPRRLVANTIGYRRRKGTLALLEDLATAVAGWPARVVEFEQHIGVAQSLKHLRSRRGHTASLRSAEALDLIGSAFDSFSHALDVRRINSHRSPGMYNLPEVAVFVWRLKVFSATHTLANWVEGEGDCFTFSILGNDVALYNNPVREVEPNHIANELDLPTPIRRRAFDETSTQDGVEHHQASSKYYGADRSLAIWAGNWAGLDRTQPIPAARIIPADLSDWKYRPKTGHVALDPELGRITFPPAQLPKHVWTSYHYAFSSEIGGGEYERPVIVPVGSKITYSVGPGAFSSIHEAYQKWVSDNRPHAVIEITDSEVHKGQVNIHLGKDSSLELRAANGARPVLLADRRTAHPDPLLITGEAGSRFILDGILVAGRALEIREHVDEVIIRHCTLVPGWSLHSDCAPHRPGEPSVLLMETSSRVQIEHSILGPIAVFQKEDAHLDPISLTISDSIIDSTRPDLPAIRALEDRVAPFALTIQRCTIIGQVQVHALSLAEDCIFTGELLAARRQQGCVRFCYVPPGSRTPGRYHCQPDLVEEAALALARKHQLTHSEKIALRDEERRRVEPSFVSMRFGDPGYCQLGQNCADEVKRAASDRSELGVFHDLYQPQKEANLRTGLDEYAPAGIDAGIVFVT